jgi:hypothetical protein
VGGVKEMVRGGKIGGFYPFIESATVSRKLPNPFNFKGLGSILQTKSALGTRIAKLVK